VKKRPQHRTQLPQIPLPPAAGAAVTPDHDFVAAPAVAPQRDPLAAAVRRWRLVASVAAGCALLLFLAGAARAPRYRASAICGVAPVTVGIPANDVFRGVEVLDGRSVVATVAALATTRQTLDEATGRRTLRYDVVASVLPNTNLVRIDVEGTDAAEVRQVANAIPPLLSRQLRTMYGLYDVKLVSAADAPPPVGSGRGRMVTAGLLGGLLLGTGAAWILERNQRPGGV
jgi:capsular polysaccharide biosynthesis protein